jgi:hypothetical protein
MRYLCLAGLAGISVLSACNDSLPPAPGPDTALAYHFDTLAAEASAASQLNRAAALDMALRAIADGAIPDTVRLLVGSASDTVKYATVSWSIANAIVDASGDDSVADSLMVFLAWRTSSPDTIFVARVGDPTLSDLVQAELETLGLTVNMRGDSGASGALVTGNTVTLADSGNVAAGYDVAGEPCPFVNVSSVTNDDGTACSREIIDWSFTLRFSPSSVWSISAAASQGVVILN